MRKPGNIFLAFFLQLAQIGHITQSNDQTLAAFDFPGDASDANGSVRPERPLQFVGIQSTGVQGGGDNRLHAAHRKQAVGCAPDQPVALLIK